MYMVLIDVGYSVLLIHVTRVLCSIFVLDVVMDLVVVCSSSVVSRLSDV